MEKHLCTSLLATGPQRGACGNVTAFALAIGAFVVIGLLLFFLNYAGIIGSSGEHRTAVEAAALTAASDLSRIVVDDPNYGFVALSDYPPIGNAVKDKTGAPLPVQSINTISATARLDLLLASAIGEPTMLELARRDAANARAAAKRLTAALAQACAGTGTYGDIDGNKIDVPGHARDVYLANMVRMGGGKPIVSAFKVSLGWLKGGGTTVTPIPQPQDKSAVAWDQQINGRYKSFVNIPAVGENFSFAGASDQSSLVDSRLFEPYGDDWPCSVVQVYAEHSSSGDAGVLQSVACAQPGAKEDLGPVQGQLVLDFPDGFVPGINSIRDILDNDQLNSRKMSPYVSKGGDWPSDDGAKLEPVEVPVGGEEPTVTQAFATGFFDWLRTNRNRASIATLIKLIDLKFQEETEDDKPDAKTLSWWPIPPAFAGSGSGHGLPTVAGAPVFIVGGLPGGDTDDRLTGFRVSENVNCFWQMSGMLASDGRIPDGVFVARLAVDPQHHHKRILTDYKGTSRIKRGAIRKFWSDVALTVAAAVETQKVAGQALGSVEKQIQDLQAKASKAREAANTARARASDLRRQAFTARQQGNLPRANQLEQEARGEEHRAREFDAEAEECEQQITALGATADRIKQAITNATKIISVSEYIRGNQKALTMGGFKPDDPKSNVTLAGKVLRFHPKAAKLNDLLNTDPPQSGEVRSPSGSLAADQSWTWEWKNEDSGDKFYYFPEVTAQNPPAVPSVSTAPNPELAESFRIVFNPNGKAKVARAAATPFANVPVPENQLYLVSFDALTTGMEPGTQTADPDQYQVTWTAVVRDMSRSLGNTSGGKHAGQPIVGNPPDYCKKPSFCVSAGEDNKMSLVSDKVAWDTSVLERQPRKTYVCGGVAFEFQLRAPVIFNMGEDATAGEQLIEPMNKGQEQGQSNNKNGPHSKHVPTLSPPVSTKYW